MNGLSEAELHVQAMRLVCEALADREQQGIEVDWDVLRQMHDQMDAMLQALQHKHRYDSSDMVDLRKDRDAARAEIETLQKQLANAQQELSEQSMVANVQTQQDAAAWQQQVDSANAEVSYLRARLDEERSVSAGLRQQLDAARAAVTLQRAGIERLQAFVEKVRSILPSDSPYSNQLLGIEAALKTLDAGTKPTPVAEPLDEEGGA